MKMTKGRKKELEILEWFMAGTKPTSAAVTVRMHASLLGVEGTEEAEDGVDSLEAFFMKSETGKLPKKVKDLDLFLRYLTAHRRIAMNVKMWLEDASLADFVNEPPVIQELFRKTL